jgi:F0F1-type ATP synthase assembly protein I
MGGENSVKITSVAACGVEFVSAVAVAVLLGLQLDKYFELSPLFLVIFFIFGCFAGYVNVIRRLASMDEPQKSSLDLPKSSPEGVGQSSDNQEKK